MSVLAMNRVTGFPFHPPHGRGARHPKRAAFYTLPRKPGKFIGNAIDGKQMIALPGIGGSRLVRFMRDKILSFYVSPIPE
jgi:hypothetical protein